MRILSRLLDLVTSDPLTLAATAVLAIAIVGLLLVISWPSSDVPATPTATAARSIAARSLAAAGLPQLDIARRTGLSRDGVALLLTRNAGGARQNSPGGEKSSLFSRWRAKRSTVGPGPQVTA